MGLFKDIAEPLIARNVPVIPLRPKTKIAFLNNWRDAATTDHVKIDEWDQEYADANGACVAFAKPDGIWFFEIDRQDFLQTLELQTGHKMPDTFTVRSSPGRGHFYFKQTPESIAMGNAQAKDDKGELWSARVDNRYVVAPGSFHPTSGKRYETLRDVEIVPGPNWLVNWCLSQRKAEEQKSPVTASVDGPKIPRGAHDTTLTRIAGKLRQDGLEEHSICDALIEVCLNRCENYGPDYQDMCKKIAKSVARYPISEPVRVLFGGVPLGQQAVVMPQVIVPDAIKAMPYPVFPRWVMKGTSLYEGLVKPVCDVNSRYPEFMFMPAVTLMLNYLSGKVRIEYKNHSPSFYLVSIGRKGRVIKSSSVKDAVEYLTYAGIVSDAGPTSRTADGRSFIFTAGSPEGLGLEMTRTNCRNAVLFYDELSSLTSKAGIEGSSLVPNLLLMYESAKFANVVKSRRDQYNFEPGTYCTSLIACTTDKNFLQHWSKMAGNSSGLDERFFFLYQPEILADLKPYTYIDTKEAAVETKKRIDKAVRQGLYSIDDQTPLEKRINKLGNRTEIRAEKLGLYFAIDLGLDSIDEGCIDRALAICDYELAVKRYLKIFEATTSEGRLQNEIIQVLQRSAGVIQKRELERIVHPMKYGTPLYNRCYVGLLQGGYIAEQGTGVKGDPQMIILIRNIEDEDED